jgi:hypothetical protein
MSKINTHIEGMAKHLSALAKILPGEIKKAEKNLKPEDAGKIQEALKNSDFENVMKGFDKAKLDLTNLRNQF